ncbi:MAG: glycerophosphodiester phosphodiesterase [Chloroflexi bacterium]|nr:glycerophosphodiester phosphodiesterase [Chloroflexota bacterium]
MIRQALENRFLISGHRGYSAKYPENTLLSFAQAIELGVDMLELDLHLSRDGVIMLMHDATLERTTNGSGPLSDYTCSELKALDAGGWKGACFEGLKIPTFEEFCTLVKPHSTILCSVEIKPAADDIACLDAAVAMTNAFGITDRCVFTSFDAAVTDHIHDTYGLPNLGYWDKYMTNVQPESGDKLWSVGVPMVDVNPEHIAMWRARGIWPCAFCADTDEQVEQCLAAGAAMVTSNDPLPALRITRARGMR